MIEEGKLLLGWPNHIDHTTLTGGSWEAELPLTNLHDPTFAEQARTVGLATANTQLLATLGRFRPIGVVALAAHNLTASARWRVTVYYDAEATSIAHQSEWRRVWPAVYSTLELEFEYDNWWGGEFSDDDRQNFTPLATLFLPQSHVARAVRIEMDDPGNPEGFITLGRVFVGGLWQPDYNMSYGCQWGYEIDTTFETAGNADRTRYPDVATPKRTVSFALEHLSQEEGFRRALAIDRTLGLHGEILYAEGTQATPESFAKTFIGQQMQINALTHPYAMTYSKPMALMEIL
ncbi:hypothetical protein CLM76_09455 [Vreelandella venusta]|nr:hypothetical protein CLM76_09455 [Halomonas hydrothermalis]